MNQDKLTQKLYNVLLNILEVKFTKRELEFIANFIDIKEVFLNAYNDAHLQDEEFSQQNES